MQTNDREMETNFNKDTWKEGMTVYNMAVGKGKIYKISPFDGDRAIECHMDNSSTCFLPYSGKNGHDITILFPYEIEVIKKPEFKTGDWGFVDESENERRQFCFEYDGMYYCINNSLSIDKTANTTIYVGAFKRFKPIPKYTESDKENAIKVLTEMGVLKEGKILV